MKGDMLVSLSTEGTLRLDLAIGGRRKVGRLEWPNPSWPFVVGLAADRGVPLGLNRSQLCVWHSRTILPTVRSALSSI